MTADAQGGLTILVVEDPFIRSFVKSLLRRHKARVVGAEEETAIELLRSGAVAVDVLITNHPLVLAEAAADLPLLYMAAFPEPEQAARYRKYRMLHKPFRPEQLVAALQELIDLPARD